MIYITPDLGLAVAYYTTAEERERLEEESKRNAKPMTEEEWVRSVSQ